jgi:hypothetical protein
MDKDPDFLVDLTTCGSDFEAQTLVEALKARGIFAQAFTHAGSTLAWDIAVTQPFRVAVRRADLERAKFEMASLRADSVDIDWSEVDVGQPEAGETRPVPRNDRARRRRRMQAVGIFLMFLAILTPIFARSMLSLVMTAVFALLAMLSFLSDADTRRTG